MQNKPKMVKKELVAKKVLFLKKSEDDLPVQ